MRYALLCLVVFAGCGSATAGRSTTRSAPTQAAPTPAEKAVLEFATGLYPNQHIRRAICDEVGFAPEGDIYSCSLVTDRMTTEPKEWTITEEPSMGQLVAIPSDAM